MAGQRQITKLPRDTGVAGWNASLNAAPSYPQASGTIHADWLVIGAGFAGLSAAWKQGALVRGRPDAIRVS